VIAHEKYLPHSAYCVQRNRYRFVGSPSAPQCGHFGVFSFAIRCSSSSNTCHKGFPKGFFLEATVAIPAVVSGREAYDSAEQNGTAVDDDPSTSSQSHDDLLIELVLLIGTQDDGRSGHDSQRRILGDTRIGFDK